MKKALLYLLIFSYTTVVVKPVLPTISDTLAHIFWYSEHMATVHFENGQFHVHKEYAAAAKKGLPEKNNGQKEDDLVSFHLSPVEDYTFNTDNPLERRFIPSASALSFADSSAVYPPPKFV